MAIGRAWGRACSYRWAGQLLAQKDFALAFGRKKMSKAALASKPKIELQERSVRGSHAMRREATRRKVFDACIATIYESGFATASTLEVAKRANISRGALLKQFPTRSDMLCEVMRELLRQSVVNMQTFIKDVPPGIERVIAYADAGWHFYRTPIGIVFIEIALGARDNEQLGEMLATIGLEREEFEATRIWEDMALAGATDRHAVATAVLGMVATMRGLAIEHMWNRNSDLVQATFEAHRQRFAETLHSLI